MCIVTDREFCFSSTRTSAAAGLAIDRVSVRQTGTGLYDTTLAAYKTMAARFPAAVPNHVLIFTDGRNEADRPTLSLEQLGQRLAAAKDPKRPVELTVVAFGGQPEAEALAKTLEPVDGYLDALRSADEVKAAFIHAAAGGIHE